MNVNERGLCQQIGHTVTDESTEYCNGCGARLAEYCAYCGVLVWGDYAEKCLCDDDDDYDYSDEEYWDDEEE